MNEITDVYRAPDDLTVIRLRPGESVGDVSNPNHLATEIVDNMLDEVANGHADSGSLYFDDSNNSVWVTDNGRGFSVYDMGVEKIGKKLDSVVALCTIKHSGSKFDNNEYAHLIGMHGVGLVAVNALSEWLIIRTKNRKNPKEFFEYVFVDGELKQKQLIEPDPLWSTIVGFKPNSRYFDTDQFNREPFVERLLLSIAKYPKSKFIYQNKQLTNIDYSILIRRFLGVQDNFGLYQLSYTVDTDYFDNSTETIKTYNWKGSIIKCYLSYSEDLVTEVKGDVNLRVCDGTYIASFQTLLKNCIGKRLNKKKYKDINQALYLLGLKLYISLTVPEPRFDSQTKTRMTLKVQKALINPLEQQVEWFLDQPNIMQTIEKNISTRVLKQIKQRTVTNTISDDNPLVDSHKMPGKTLYLIEGKSAKGTLKQIREKNEGIFEVGGKIINVEKNSIIKVEQNKDIKFFNEAVGVENRKRYEELVILADADIDGWHIVTLVTQMICRLRPSYIKNGNAYVIFTPLFGAIKKNEFIPVYNSEKREEYIKQGYEVPRFKGLGEMNPDQLKQVIARKNWYRLKWPDSNEKLDTLLNIINNKQYKKMIMNDDRFGFKNIMNHISEDK